MDKRRKHTSIYIIGAQCTGKTTLVDALHPWLLANKLVSEVAVIKEAARGVLRNHSFTRQDIMTNPARCMDLQRLILEAQLQKEQEMSNSSMLVSDRSGIDPIVYAAMYGQEGGAKELLKSTSSEKLIEKMRSALVVVCEPVYAWLYDDGVRLMPKDNEEWLRMHQLFCSVMESVDLDYVVLPSATSTVSDRLAFVLERWSIWETKQGDVTKVQKT